ncbi:hypothetical protein EJ08DRAFT_696400 [Tothia fuscella]|uniref:Uncharacterized protein n=1 Tax=Tothia fuscella TaxID=1048955 RepID=A0A9P4NUD2_9PEZI|nr:hypothetical protein EJ08DRAFT_696400 [Tothia fuscella]
MTNTLLLGVVTVGVVVAVHLLHKYWSEKRASKNAPPSRLMSLPAELRNEIYSYLLEPEPTQAPMMRQVAETIMGTPLVNICFTRILAFCRPVLELSPIRLRLPFYTPPRAHSTPTYEHLNRMTLASKQFKSEFMDVYCRIFTFNFTLDASDITHEKPFKIGEETLGRMRKCMLKILATPGIVGAFDPREAPADWLLRDKVFAAMSQMTSLQDMVLSINACGNQLWNPLWLWHFTSQAFKGSPIKAFRRIEFKLEGWTLREPNHLARNPMGEWEWHCSENHCVRVDEETSQPVREFCAALYHECRICDPLPMTDGDETEDA